MAHRSEMSGYADEADAYSIGEFCKRHRISPQMFYKMTYKPVVFRVGTRVLISKESAARWRAEREHATAAESLT